MVRRLEQLASVIGFLAVVGGVAHWSVPGACVVGGLLLIGSSITFRRVRP